MARRESTDVLRKARKVFDTARMGLADLEGDDPARRIPGLHNVIVFGRSVTFVMQNLRTVDAPAFNAWYEPRQAEMRTDPLLRYFNKLRTDLEKEGGADTTTNAFVEYLDTDMLRELKKDAPPGATDFFIGDRAGGTGWIVELPDGTQERYYVSLPKSLGIHSWVSFSDPPTEHLGKPIEDLSVPALARLYLDYIGGLLVEAERTFGPPVRYN